MGLSASQGRMLGLTARMSDLEYQAQNVTNAKMRLADNSEAVSKNYLEALSAKKLTVKNPQNNTMVDASINSIYKMNDNNLNGTKRAIVNAKGEFVYAEGTNPQSLMSKIVAYKTETVTDETTGKETVETNAVSPFSESGVKVAEKGISKEQANSAQWLYEQLSAGNLFIVEFDEEGGGDGKGAWDKISFNSDDAQLVTANDDVALAQAEAEYETKMAEIQSKDKKFDLELKQIETQHTAVQTEYDSVKKVMDKNIDRTFKIFS